MTGMRRAAFARRTEKRIPLFGLSLRRLKRGGAREALPPRGCVEAHRRAGDARPLRPPFGSQSLSTYLAARSCGLDVVVWGPYAEDWVECAPEAVAERGLSDLRAGQILLLHDGLEMPDGEARPTFDRVRAFELILDGLETRGLAGATVGSLIAEGGARRTAWFRG